MSRQFVQNQFMQEFLILNILMDSMLWTLEVLYFLRPSTICPNINRPTSNEKK